MKARKILTLVLTVLLVATVLFIWGNSMESKNESIEHSKEFAEAVEPTLEFSIGEGNITDPLVRKLAHFIEFAVLGCELALLIILRRRMKLQAAVNCLFVGLSIAVTDEALQLLSDRGSQVQDILLDFASVSTGIALIFLIYWIC